MKEKENIKNKAIIRFIFGVFFIFFDFVLTIGSCIEKEYDIDELIPYILLVSLPMLVLGVILLKNANTYRKAMRKLEGTRASLLMYRTILFCPILFHSMPLCSVCVVYINSFNPIERQ